MLYLSSFTSSVSGNLFVKSVHFTACVYLYYNICKSFLHHLCISFTASVYLFYSICVSLLQHLCISFTASVYLFYSICVSLLHHLCISFTASVYLFNSICVSLLQNLCISFTSSVYLFYSICVSLLQHLCISFTASVYLFYSICVSLLQHLCISFTASVELQSHRFESSDEGTIITSTLHFSFEGDWDQVADISVIYNNDTESVIEYLPGGQQNYTLRYSSPSGICKDFMNFIFRRFLKHKYNPRQAHIVYRLIGNIFHDHF